MADNLSYLVIAAILFAVELFYFYLAKRFNIIDKPNERSSHTHITLRGGGILFLIGALLWAFFFRGFTDYPWFMFGLTVIAMISFVDDIYSLPDWIRLVFHFLAVFIMFCQFGILHWNLWWLIPIIWIVCVGIINAFNFMDGINGITGGYSIAVLVPLLIVNNLADCSGFIKQDFLWVILISVLVFCFFNFRKRAICFAGDVGAVSIAFILVFALGLLIIQSGDFTYIMFLSVYGVDSVLTIIHRIMLRENLGVAHRKHAYQLMVNELQIPHVVVSLFYMGLQLLVSAGLIFLPINHWVYSIIVLLLLVLSYLLFMKKYYPLHEAYLRSL